MEPSINYQATSRYFRGPGCAIVLAVILAFIGVFTLSSSWVAALLLIGLAAIIGVVHFKMRSNDPTSVDAALETVTSQVRTTARARFGVFPHQAPPLEVVGFVRTRATAGPIVELKEQDGRIRTNWVGGFVAYFSEKQVHIFTTEKTVEFFYEDVVSLSTESDKNGTRLSLTVKDGSRYDAPITDEAAVDRELAAARELIRRRRS
jgi:hypothetical protein